MIAERALTTAREKVLLMFYVRFMLKSHFPQVSENFKQFSLIVVLHSTFIDVVKKRLNGLIVKYILRENTKKCGDDFIAIIPRLKCGLFYLSHIFTATISSHLHVFQTLS